jgi:hypothetical protein
MSWSSAFAAPFPSESLNLFDHFSFDQFSMVQCSCNVPWRCRRRRHAGDLARAAAVGLVGTVRRVVLGDSVGLSNVRALREARLTSAPTRASAPRCLVRPRARRAAFGLALASFVAAPTARADLDLRWDAPAGCPQRGEVLDRIRSLAGSAFDRTEGLLVEGRVARVNGRFSLTLLVRDGREVRTRSIASDSCADLAGAAAITLALLLGVDVGSTEPPADDGADDPAGPKGESDARNAGGSDERGSEEPGGRSDQRAPLAERAQPAVPGASTSRGWAVVVRAPMVAADVGPLPHPTVGVGLGLGIRYEAWRLLLAGHVSRTQTLRAEESGEAFGAEVQRMTGHIVTCRGWRWPRFEVAPCVGLALEHVTATGFGDSVVPGSRRATWPAPSAGAVGHWYAMESLAFFVGGTGYLQLARPRLVIDGLGEIGHLAPAAVAATVGAEWIL